MQKGLGPRYMSCAPWRGKYSSKQVSYFMPTFTWEKDLGRSNTVKGVLSIIPETWVSDCFRYVAVPETATFYFVNAAPRTESFKDYLIPDRDTWAEYDVACFARRNGCKNC